MGVRRVPSKGGLEFQVQRGVRDSRIRFDNWLDLTQGLSVRVGLDLIQTRYCDSRLKF